MAEGITFTAVVGIGEILQGTDIAVLIAERTDLMDRDVVVVTSKIVSKSLGLATRQDKDVVLAAQTDRVVARRDATRIVRTHHGLTMAAAGIDASNAEPGTLLPLPSDPDAEARSIRKRLRDLTGRSVAVVISDTAGRAWRNGQTDIAIGCAGLVAVESFAGQVDSHGQPLVVTAPAVADEIAAGAELAAGKLGRRPVVIVRGLADHLVTSDDGPGARALVRDEGSDLFGLGTREAVVASLAPGGDARGFATHDINTPTLVDLALPPEGIDVRLVDDRQLVVHYPPHLPVEAGQLTQRLTALAIAHGICGLTVQAVPESPRDSDGSTCQ